MCVVSGEWRVERRKNTFLVELYPIIMHHATGGTIPSLSLPLFPYIEPPIVLVTIKLRAASSRQCPDSPYLNTFLNGNFVGSNADLWVDWGLIGCRYTGEF